MRNNKKEWSFFLSVLSQHLPSESIGFYDFEIHSIWWWWWKDEVSFMYGWEKKAKKRER